MIRLVGILTGSAIAIAMLLLVLGVPRFAEPQNDVFEAPADNAVAEVSIETGSTEAVLTPVAVPVAAEAPPAAPAETPAEPEQDAPPEAAPEPEIDVEPVAQTQETVVVPTAVEAAPTEQNWYAFWSPFRSRIAADGFVAELQRTTGLDYRVVKLKPGIYEVAFAYNDDAEIQEILSRISTATGLDMSGG